MEDLARRVNMASSTFNRHFKQVTSLSPLQFQKRLRLYEAERLMLQEGKDAGTEALMVGYESGSQFNREYKRQFGAFRLLFTHIIPPSVGLGKEQRGLDMESPSWNPYVVIRQREEKRNL